MNDQNQNDNQNQPGAMPSPVQQDSNQGQNPQGDSTGMPNLNDMPNPMAPAGQDQTPVAETPEPVVPVAENPMGGVSEPAQEPGSPMGQQTTDEDNSNQGGQQ